ncbi:DUF1120 domain-containing protein [Dyella sp. Tek66A03]|uniref:DUF1120 domain-containing protein n=1 Tax=Dyella sp. Tek66A03 TaxID=3458298 RepID=UPI00403ECDD0
MNVSQPVVDYGRLNRTTLTAQYGQLPLDTRSVIVTMSCPVNTDMTLWFRAPAATADRFLWSGVVPGSYALSVSDAVLDGEVVDLGEVTTSGTTPSPIATRLAWRPDRGVAPVHEGRVVSGRVFSIRVNVEASLDERAIKNLRDITTWRSSGLIEPAATETSTRELVIQAEVVPAACTPILAGSGIVSFGRISAQQLNSDQPTSLEPRPLALNITCDGPTRFALQMQDNREGTAITDSDVDFGLGRDGKGNKIGSFRVNVDPAQTQADITVARFVTDSSNGGVGWGAASSQVSSLSSRAWLGFTDADGSTAGPVALRTLQSILSIKVTIAPRQALDQSAEVELDGHATLEVKYL